MKKKASFFIVLLLCILFGSYNALAISDTTGPTIADFVLEENGQTLSVGDTVHISVKVTDPSGVKSVAVHLDGPSIIILGKR